MRQNGDSRDLDMILERDKRAGRNGAGRGSISNGSRGSRNGSNAGAGNRSGGARNSGNGSSAGAGNRSGSINNGNMSYGSSGSRNSAGRERGGYSEYPYAKSAGSAVQRRGGSAADVQLWNDGGKKGGSVVQYRSREAQMQYRREMRRKKRRRQMLLVRSLVGAATLILILAVGFGMWKLGTYLWSREEGKDVEAALPIEQEQQMIEENRSEKPVMEEKFLTPNEYSRPGEPLTEVTEIFVHYTANAGTSAAQNRSYFENLGITGETSASAHFVVGFNGEIIQCLPLDEIGYAVMEHNYNSISIECCYLQEDGKFEDATYQSLVKLVGWLLNEYDLGPSAVKRHYDSNGKLCPKYYVEHEDAWNQFVKDVEAYIS